MQVDSLVSEAGVYRCEAHAYLYQESHLGIEVSVCTSCLATGTVRVGNRAAPLGCSAGLWGLVYGLYSDIPWIYAVQSYVYI